MINEFARRSSIWTRIGTGLQWRILSGLLVLGYAVVATHLSAQPASIVKDLNTQAQSGDSLDRDNGMVESGGFVLFNALASISTVVQMTPFRFEPPARILDRRDLRLLCFHLR